MKNLICSNEVGYDSNLILIDGFSGTGKILIYDLLKATNQIEIVQSELLIEYLPIAYEMGLINESLAISLLKARFDEITYNLIIGRNINFRIKDLSSIFQHPKKFNYIKSIFQKVPDDKIIRNQMSQKLNIPIWGHSTSFNNDLFVKSFSNRIKIIFTLRDPLFSVENHAVYMQNILSTPRELLLKYKKGNLQYPFYAFGWEEEFSDCNNTERSINLLSNGYESLFQRVINFKGDFNKNYKLLFFEDLIINTDFIFQEVTKFLSLTYQKKYFKKLKKINKIPRHSFNTVDGYWKRYTENNINRNGETNYQLLERIEKKVRPIYFKKLLSLIKSYEKFKLSFQGID